MRNIFLLIFFFAMGYVQAQDAGSLLTVKETERIEKVLSSDDMQGRGLGTEGINKAADFIANEFKSAGLQPLKGAAGFRQEFTVIRPGASVSSGSFDNQPLESKNIVAVTPLASLQLSPKNGFEKLHIKTGQSLATEARKILQAKKDYLVLVDSSFAHDFAQLSGIKKQFFQTDKSVIFVLTATDPSAYTLAIKQEIKEQHLFNVAGILPGKSKRDEYVVFSAHYDHLGIGKPEAGDSIFNGANDDAAGTTAVIMLAKYFKALNNNERTLVFAAFTAEEIGGYGSRYFSSQLDPEQVAAMFNIEMIGTESKWGRNSAYITGYEKSDMGKILEKNLEGTGFTFYPDPYPTQQLFYRSDNATLARLGVPAHTISTSKMDSEKFYHTVKDEIGTLDLGNMTMIIKSIALSSASIVSGKDTPSRVDTNLLR